MGSLYSAHDALMGQPQPSSTAALAHVHILFPAHTVFPSAINPASVKFDSLMIEGAREYYRENADNIKQDKNKRTSSAFWGAVLQKVCPNKQVPDSNIVVEDEYKRQMKSRYGVWNIMVHNPPPLHIKTDRIIEEPDKSDIRWRYENMGRALAYNIIDRMIVRRAIEVKEPLPPNQLDKIEVWNGATKETEAEIVKQFAKNKKLGKPRLLTLRKFVSKKFGNVYHIDLIGKVEESDENKERKDFLYERIQVYMTERLERWKNVSEPLENGRDRDVITDVPSKYLPLGCYPSVGSSENELMIIADHALTSIFKDAPHLDLHTMYKKLLQKFSIISNFVNLAAIYINPRPKSFLLNVGGSNTSALGVKNKYISSIEYTTIAIPETEKKIQYATIQRLRSILEDVLRDGDGMKNNSETTQ